MRRGPPPGPPDLPSNARASLLEAIIDALPVSVALWTLPSGSNDPGDLTLVAWNKTAASLSRASGAKAVGLSMREMNTGLPTTPQAEALVRAIVDRERTEVRRMLWRGTDGSERYYDWRVTPVAGSAAVVAMDVTASARAEESAATFKALAEAAPVSLSVWRLVDPDDPGSFVLEEANEATARVTGMRVHDMLGRRLDQLYPDSVPSGRAARYVAIVRGTGPPETLHVRYETPAGEQRETFLQAFRVPGGRLGMSGMVITQFDRK